MTRSGIITIALALGGFVAAAQPSAQTPAPSTQPQEHQHAPAPVAGAAATPAQGHDMMAMHKKMMADMAAAETSLDALVARMNTATGAARVDAMAEVVTAMAQQHKAMRARMMEMHEHMMQMDHTAKPMGGSMMTR
jgi:hypothetical protein